MGVADICAEDYHSSCVKPRERWPDSPLKVRIRAQRRRATFSLLLEGRVVRTYKGHAFCGQVKEMMRLDRDLKEELAHGLRLSSPLFGYSALTDRWATEKIASSQLQHSAHHRHLPIVNKARSASKRRVKQQHHTPFVTSCSALPRPLQPQSTRQST